MEQPVVLIFGVGKEKTGLEKLATVVIDVEAVACDTVSPDGVRKLTQVTGGAAAAEDWRIATYWLNSKLAN